MFDRLYVHVPFCASKCGYCSFYSIPSPADDLLDAYLDRLGREFAEHAESASELKSVFIGGGTPTFLSASRLRRLFQGIAAEFALADGVEVSIECNPETLTPEKADVVAEFANRVSLGAQSFDESLLHTLQRRGTSADFAAATATLAERGIANIGCDLIYAVPGETMELWRNDLQRAAEAGVRHVSCYSLTLEEGCALLRECENNCPNHSIGADCEIDARMWELAGSVLGDAGIRRYEVSNYAAPGFECRHNLEIWLGDTYLGCGPAAASFDGCDRRTNPASLTEWLDGAPPEIDAISAESRAAEILAMGLRQTEGWDSAKFAERSGYSFDLRKRELAELAEAGLLTIEVDRVAPTERGLALWDIVAEKLIAD